jgi:superfamily II DNA or RNA helicase
VTGLADLIRHDPPLRTGATAVYPHKHILEKKYRFTSRYDDEVLLHRVDGQEIHLPRALCPVGAKDERSRGVVVAYPKQPEPRDYQTEVFEATFAFLAKGQSGVVNAYTGWGKSPLGFGAAAYLGVKTLVVATKDDIFKQWIDGACGQNGEPNFLGLPRDRIGVIRGDKCEIAGKDFVVAMIHTLAKRTIPPELAAQFGLVIFDEVHRVPADSFQVAASMFPAFWRLGMSADETRADGKELLIYAHIGPVRAATEAQLMVPKVLRYRSAWECPRVVRENPEEPGTKHVVRLPHEPGKTTHIEKILAADPKRNELLATLVKTAFDAGRKIVVFSTLHDHLHAIHRAAVKQGMSGKAFGYYLGAQTKADKEEREKQKGRPILLTTYSMMGEGTNIPWLDCGIQAIPRANVEQPCGRIRRDYPDKRPPVWMDVADSDSPVFTGYSSSRMTWYRSIGCEIHDMD